MDIAKAFEVAFNRKKEKNWEKIYAYSRETLQLVTNREDICLILWSGCYDEKMNEYRARFAEEGIHLNKILLLITILFHYFFCLWPI